MNEFESTPPRDGSSEPGGPDAVRRRFAQRQRDAALRRISRVRTGVIVATVGLCAGFAALVADIAPGKTYHARSSARAVGTASSTLSPGAPGQPGLSPGQAPSATAPAPDALAPVTSGGS
jgi:hypothetical protein